MKTIRDKLIAINKKRGKKVTVAFAEGQNSRVLQAAKSLWLADFIEPIFLGDKELIHQRMDLNQSVTIIMNYYKIHKNKKSAKPNGIPNEIWKLLIKDKQCRDILLRLMNRCLETGTVSKKMGNRRSNFTL